MGGRGGPWEFVMPSGDRSSFPWRPRLASQPWPLLDGFVSRRRRVHGSIATELGPGNRGGRPEPLELLGQDAEVGAAELTIWLEVVPLRPFIPRLDEDEASGRGSRDGSFQSLSDVTSKVLGCRVSQHHAVDSPARSVVPVGNHALIAQRS